MIYQKALKGLDDIRKTLPLTKDNHFDDQVVQWLDELAAYLRRKIANIAANDGTEEEKINRIIDRIDGRHDSNPSFPNKYNTPLDRVVFLFDELMDYVGEDKPKVNPVRVEKQKMKLNKIKAAHAARLQEMLRKQADNERRFYLFTKDVKADPIEFMRGLFGKNNKYDRNGAQYCAVKQVDLKDGTILYMFTLLFRRNAPHYNYFLFGNAGEGVVEVFDQVKSNFNVIGSVTHNNENINVWAIEGLTGLHELCDALNKL